MIENFIAFRSFPTLNQAKELELLLNKNNIKTALGDNIPPFDINFSGSTLQNQYEIKIFHAALIFLSGIINSTTSNNIAAARNQGK